MRKLILALLVLALPAQVARGICDLPPPAPIPKDTPLPPRGGTPPPPGTPPGPTTPEPPLPGQTTPNRDAPGARTRGGGGGYAGSWHLWWELNRENLLGLRTTLERRDVVSGGKRFGGGALALHRVRVRTALRHIALDPTAEGSLRATALRALGRAGSAEDARTFLGLLKTRSVPREVLNGAVIGLGCLPPAATDEALRGRVAALFDDVVAGRLALPGSTRLLAIMALSLHARDNRALSRSLALRCARDCSSANEAAALLYACGLSRDPLLTLPIFEAARSGTLGGKKLHDVARSHATLALAMTGDPGAVPALGQVLRSRRAPVQTRRSAALAIGLLLRSESVIGKHRDQACDALLRSLRKDRDPMVRAYCIVGMGTAHEPEFGVDALLERVDRSGDPVVRPFAAIALGLAAKRLPEAKAKESRRLLLREMQKTRDIECSAALAIAAGLSGAVAAREELIERLSHERLNAAIRGPAIQGLGLLGRTSPEIERKLLATLEDGSDVVVEDSALALGLLGGRSAARTLVVKLATTRSEPVQAHMVVALSHLGGATAIEPLLELLEDRSKKHTMRESAAAALGVLVDDRERDPLFEIDAHTNPFALTAASRELVRVY